MTSFLDFPAELRLHIYEVSLKDILDRPACTCTARLIDRFKTLRSLHLTCRQTYSEIKSFFCKELSHRVYFYFDDACKLYDFHYYALGREDLEQVNFSLGHCSSDHMNSPSRAEDVWEVIHAQPGLDESFHEDGHDYHETRYGFAFQQPSRSLYALLDKVREMDGDNTRACATLDFVASDSGLALSLHRDGLERDFSVELHGKLKALTFGGVDIAGQRAWLNYRRDSQWRPWHGSRSQSPDLDEGQRREWDADSWGVPDRPESARSEDAVEFRWQLNFGEEEEDST